MITIKEKVEWVVALEAVEVAVVLVEVVGALEVVLVEEWDVGMDLEDFRMKLSLLFLLTSVDWLLEKVVKLSVRLTNSLGHMLNFRNILVLTLMRSCLTSKEVLIKFSMLFR